MLSAVRDQSLHFIQCLGQTLCPPTKASMSVRLPALKPMHTSYQERLGSMSELMRKPTQCDEETESILVEEMVRKICTFESEEHFLDFLDELKNHRMSSRVEKASLPGG